MNQSNPSSEPEGLLIIHPGALGDVIVMFNLIASLARNQRKITLVCRESVGWLATNLRLVDRFLPMETAWWSTLYSADPDERVRSFLADFSQIILFSVNRDLERIISDCVSVPCLQVPPRPPATERIHVTRFAAECMVKNKIIGQIPSPQKAVCRQGTRSYSQPATSVPAPVFLHPGAGSLRKRWPLSAFIEVGAEIIAGGGRAELIIGPADRDLLDKGQPSGLKLIELSEIAELVDLLAKAAGFIGNDSGVAHLAACLGLPTVAIFTASDPLRWKPNGPAVAALSPDMACEPCFETREVNCSQPVCQIAITPRMVLEAYGRLSNEKVNG